MKETGNHPQDFSPLVDHDTTDGRYQELQNHVDSCLTCREEVRAIESFDRMFRSQHLEIEVPPFQWARIQARLERSGQGRWRAAFEALKPHRLVWKLAAGVFLALVLGVSGLEFYQYNQRSQFLALVTYTAAERQRIETAENPFRSFLAAQDVNPFEKVQIPEDKINPFAVR
jgi:hypothetical protein